MFIVLKRKTLVLSLAFIVITVLLAVSIGVTSASAVFFGESNRKIPVYSVDVETEDKVIALTFDAAWGADKTHGIIDLLNEFGADATFFLVGFWIDRYPDAVKDIAAAGLDIGNHSENHLNMSRLDKNAVLNEINSVNEKVEKLTGTRPTYFRAPYGDYDNRLMTCLEEVGMVGVQWSIDSLDWKGLSAKDITERIVPKAKSGDIVLFHNNSDHVLDALPIVLTALKAKGFRFVALSDLVLTENYTIDSRGVQHKK